MVLFLGIIRLLFPGIRTHAESFDVKPSAAQDSVSAPVVAQAPVADASDPKEQPIEIHAADHSASGGYHKIYSVASFNDCFPDLQEVQIVAAQRWGVTPVANREEAERRKNELVYVGANPYFDIDPRMSQSIPYLVPRASRLVDMIARNYLDSLAIKGIPLHKIVVSSCLRTEMDVQNMKGKNVNVSENSCHRFGTTFDISYVTYSTVAPPGETRRQVRNDTLKWVLAEVLDDIRRQDLCYIKHETKQPCFHITVR